MAKSVKTQVLRLKFHKLETIEVSNYGKKCFYYVISINAAVHDMVNALKPLHATWGAFLSSYSGSKLAQEPKKRT